MFRHLQRRCGRPALRSGSRPARDCSVGIQDNRLVVATFPVCAGCGHAGRRWRGGCSRHNHRAGRRRCRRRGGCAARLVRGGPWVNTPGQTLPVSHRRVDGDNCQPEHWHQQLRHTSRVSPIAFHARILLRHAGSAPRYVSSHHNDCDRPIFLGVVTWAGAAFTILFWARFYPWFGHSMRALLPD